MRKTATTLLTLALTTGLAASAFAASAVRISQVYGGGGSSQATATYKVDYVELFNFSNTAVNLSGWTIEYGSATGNWGSSAGNIFTFPSGASIAACSYVLVALGTPGTGGADLPVTPDYSNTTTSMSATSGKVGLFTAVNSNLACGSEIPGTLVDKVGYGTSNCPEVANVATLSNATGAVRNSNGIQDTDNNGADFTVVTNPTPRNSASPVNQQCLVTPTQKNTWGRIKTIYR